VDPEHVGRWILQELVYRSERASLFRAADRTNPDRHVALKRGRPLHRLKDVTLTDLATVFWGPGAVAQMVRHEADVLQRLGNRCTPRLVERGEDASTNSPWFAVDWFDGTRLDRSALAGSGDWDAVVHVGIQLAGALDEAGQQGIVHRDLKPANVLVRLDSDAPPVVQLVDWELAAVGERRVWGVVGSSAWMAPEAVALAVDPSRRDDARADLYSLGATLWFLCTGRAPFARERGRGAHVMDTVPDLRTKRPDTPAWLADLIGWLMAKHPDDRPPGAATVAELLAERRCKRPAPCRRPLVHSAREALAEADLVGAADRLFADGLEADPADLLELGIATVRLGESIRILRAFAAELADDPRAQRLAGECLRRLGRPQEAMTRLRPLISEGLDLPTARLWAGCLRDLAGADAATSFCLGQVAGAPGTHQALLVDQVEALWLRSAARPTRSELSSLSLCAAWLALDSIGEPQSQVLWRLVLAAVDELSEDPPPRTMLAASLAWSMLGDEAQAESFLHDAHHRGAFAELDVRIPVPPSLLSSANTRRTLSLLAFGAFDAATRQVASPVKAGEWRDRLRVALCTGRAADARNALERARELEPDAADLPPLECLVRLEAGDVDEALTVCRQACAAAPGDGWHQSLLGEVLLACGADRDALETAVAGVNTTPGRRTGTVLATVAKTVGAWDLAVGACLAVLAGDPVDRVALSLLLESVDHLEGTSAHRVGIHRLVAELRDRRHPAGPLLGAAMVRGAQDDALPWRSLSEVRLALGDPAGAVVAARAAVWLEPSDAAGWLLLCGATLRAGDPATALETARLAVMALPDEPRLGSALVEAASAAGGIDELMDPDDDAGLAIAVAEMLALQRAGLVSQAHALAEELNLVDHVDGAELVAALRWAAQDLEGVVTLARELRERGVHTVLSQRLLVRALRVLARFEEALSACEELDGLSPGGPVASRERVRVLLCAQRPLAALAEARFLLSRFGVHATHLFLEGAALLLAGRAADGERAARRLVVAAPEAPRSWLLAAWARAEAGDKAAAVAAATTMFALDPEAKAALGIMGGLGTDPVSVPWLELLQAWIDR